MNGAALDRPRGSGPARGFPVERLQDARRQRVPASTGSTPQWQPPRPQEVVDEWVEAHRRDNGERSGDCRVQAGETGRRRGSRESGR